MIEINMPCDVVSIGHNGNNFVISCEYRVVYEERSAMFYKLLTPRFNPELIHRNFSQYDNRLVANIPNEKGQVFQYHELAFRVDKNNNVEKISYETDNARLLQPFVNESMCVTTQKYVVIIAANQMLLKPIFYKLFDIKLPDKLSRRDVIVFDKKTNKISIFHFKQGIYSLAINPEETMIAVGYEQKIYLIDLE